jgi:hypothetical protein
MASPISIDEKKSEDLEMFYLIWLDSNSSGERDTEQKLRSIINQLKKFTNVKQCEEYIKQTSDQDRLILIVSGSLGREIVPLIHDIRQVISIYVYCMNKQLNEGWSSKYSKVRR